MVDAQKKKYAVVMIVKCHFAFKSMHAKTTFPAITEKIHQITEIGMHCLKGKYINRLSMQVS